MEEKSINEEILEKIQKELERIPELLDNDSYHFQDRHMMFQTYLLYRTLDEIEGIHNALCVFHNEKANQEEASEPRNATPLETIDERLHRIENELAEARKLRDQLIAGLGKALVVMHDHVPCKPIGFDYESLRQFRKQ